MSTVPLPLAIVDPSGFSMQLSVVQSAFGAPFGGSEQVVDLLNDRWLASLNIPPCSLDDAPAVEAFIGAMRGMSNTVDLYHLARPEPRGTMRGTPICNFAPQGASSVMLPNAGIGATLLTGDLIGIQGLLLMVQSDCAADGAGSMVVPVVNRLRAAILGGAPVTWDRPTAPFRLMTKTSVQYQAGYAEGVSLDFAEKIS